MDPQRKSLDENSENRSYAYPGMHMSDNKLNSDLLSDAFMPFYYPSTAFWHKRKDKAAGTQFLPPCD